MQKDAHAGIRLWLARLWHLPDGISWMQPLPPAHRRGIIAALIVVLLAFLWPVSAPHERAPQPVNDHPGKEVPLQAETYNNPPATQPTQPKQDNDQWRSYQIASGQTLAQLFRDNDLPVNDVFAMARVEGDEQPLSSLRSGQQVKIRQDTHGVVTGLTVEGDNGPVLFTRQPDGSFIRAQ